MCGGIITQDFIIFFILIFFQLRDANYHICSVKYSVPHMDLQIFYYPKHFLLVSKHIFTRVWSLTEVQQMLSDCLLHAVQPKVLHCSMETGNKHLKMTPVIPKCGFNNLSTECHNCRRVKAKHERDWGVGRSLIILQRIKNRRRVRFSLLTSVFGYKFPSSSSQVSRRGELVVPRRALRGVRVRTAGGRHSHRLRSGIPAGGLRRHLLPRQDVTGSVWQGRVRGPNTVRRTAHAPQETVNLSYMKQYSSSLCLKKVLVRGE